MSSKIFPPRLAPSADDPLREDREAEVDASSVVCLVFVASRSIIIVVDAFFFQKFPRHETGGALLCGALARFAPPKNQEIKSSLPLTHPLLFPKTLPHTSSNQIIRTTKEKKNA
jgi:hypothetical protein